MLSLNSVSIGKQYSPFPPSLTQLPQLVHFEEKTKEQGKTGIDNGTKEKTFSVQICVL